jgi:hypothetical protein
MAVSSLGGGLGCSTTTPLVVSAVECAISFRNFQALSFFILLLKVPFTFIILEI